MSELKARAAVAGSLRSGAVIGLISAACFAGCGGGGNTTYSASRFTECLQTREAGPTDLAAEHSSEQRSIRDRLAAEAREQNGAVRAFTNTEDPNASSISVLFFRGDDEAKRAAQRVKDDMKAEEIRQREAGLQPEHIAPPKIRGNVVILDRPTEAQSRVLDECLDRSSG